MAIQKSNRNKNLIFNIVIFAVTIALVVVAAYLAGLKRYNSRALMVVYFVLGAIASGILHVVFHELGHLIAGKRNKMVLYAIRFFIISFVRTNGKLKYKTDMNFTTIGETVLLPVGNQNLVKRYSSVAMGGLMGSVVFCCLGIVGMAMVNYLPAIAYSFTSMVLPIGMYNLLTNALPMQMEGSMNDGAIVHGAKRGDDTIKVAVNMLQVEAELYQGKTFSEIDKSIYFDLPQLPETDLMFVTLLVNRYNYFLDLGDLEMALKVSDRLYSLIDDLPKNVVRQLKENFLYDACVLKLNENDADDFAAETEKALNKDNSATGLRIKSAYLLYVVKDYDNARKFIEEGLKQAEKDTFKGNGRFESKLLLRLKEELSTRVEAE